MPFACMEFVYKPLDYCGTFFFSVVAGGLHIFHVILKSRKKAGLLNLKKDCFYLIIDKSNIALAVSDAKPQIGG